MAEPGSNPGSLTPGSAWTTRLQGERTGSRRGAHLPAVTERMQPQCLNEGPGASIVRAVQCELDVAMGSGHRGGQPPEDLVGTMGLLALSRTWSQGNLEALVQP